MEEIIPRYEFRISGENLGKTEYRVRKKHIPGNPRESHEIYLLSGASTRFNIKIRNGRLDVKELEGMRGVLELWKPAWLTEFPVDGRLVAGFLADGITGNPVIPEREYYNLPELLTELIEPNPELLSVNVYKRREPFTYLECHCEIAGITAAGYTFTSIAVEADDPEKVMRCIHDLGIDKYENTNYIRILRMMTGIE